MVFVPRFYFKPITNVETREPIAALTFDDGPNPEATMNVLNILEKYNARATFFVVGEEARKFPKIINEIAEGGHGIGNHSWVHFNLTQVRSRLTRMRWMRACAKAVRPHPLSLFRPPFGAHNRQIEFDAFLLRYKIILWNGSAQDWIPQRAEDIAKKMIDRIKPGSIFLLHDGIYRASTGNLNANISADRKDMIQGLSWALDETKGKIKFVTVNELLRSGQPISQWPIPSQQ
jgi:peptidoglycan-N-acetylglucosamine deacetylase